MIHGIPGHFANIIQKHGVRLARDSANEIDRQLSVPEVGNRIKRLPGCIDASPPADRA
jgi:hypothetical protein